MLNLEAIKARLGTFVTVGSQTATAPLKPRVRGYCAVTLADVRALIGEVERLRQRLADIELAAHACEGRTEGKLR